MEPSVQLLLRDMWKENFTVVGEHLLQRIEAKQSDLLPLGEPKLPTGEMVPEHLELRSKDFRISCVYQEG